MMAKAQPQYVLTSVTHTGLMVYGMWQGESVPASTVLDSLDDRHPCVLATSVHVLVSAMLDHVCSTLNFQIMHVLRVCPVQSVHVVRLCMCVTEIRLAPPFLREESYARADGGLLKFLLCRVTDMDSRTSTLQSLRRPVAISPALHSLGGGCVVFRSSSFTNP